MLLSWRHNGRQPLVRVLVLKPSPSLDLGGAAAIALIDTGSTISGVSGAIAGRLGLVPRGKRPLGSAGGETHPERYVFRLGFEPDAESGGAPAFPFVFDDVIGFELFRNDRFDALIGMDVLGRCDLSMTRNGTCTLRFGTE